MNTQVTPQEKRALACHTVKLRRCHVCGILYQEYAFVKAGYSTLCPACAEFRKSLERGNAQEGEV